MTARYELRLADGRTVSWPGASWLDAATRYVDCHPAAVIVAWRPADRHGLFVGAPT